MPLNAVEIRAHTLKFLAIDFRIDRAQNIRTKLALYYFRQITP